MLPFLLVASAGGIVLSLHHIYRLTHSPIRKNLALYVIFFIILAGSGYSVYSHESILHSGLTGSLGNAEGVVLYLKRSGLLSEHLIAQTPSELPINYYFNKHDCPLNYLNRVARPGEKVVVIVNQDWGQTVESVLQANGGTAAPPESARKLFFEMPGVAVYSMTLNE